MKKSLLFLVCLFIGTFSSASLMAQTAESINPTAAADIALVKGFLTNLVAGNGAAAKSATNEGMKSYGPGVGDSTTIDLMVEAWVKNQETFKDIKITWIGGASILAVKGPFKGTQVYLWGNWSGTNKALGKTATNSFQYTAILHNGKISFAATYYDALSMMQQLGYTLKEPE